MEFDFFLSRAIAGMMDIYVEFGLYAKIDIFDFGSLCHSPDFFSIAS